MKPATVLRMLTDESIIGFNSRGHSASLERVRAQLLYAGIDTTVDAMRDALGQAEAGTYSAFEPELPISRHNTYFGWEYRLRPAREDYAAARKCIDAVYAVTDKLDRSLSHVLLADGTPIEIETVRPRAFAVAMGYLRARWVKGNFTCPKEATIQRWIEDPK